jgi:hypothetical protein
MRTAPLAPGFSAKLSRMTISPNEVPLEQGGWCRWYRKYASGNTVLEGLEKEARMAKRGLWADPQPVPPWAWRKRGM